MLEAIVASRFTRFPPDNWDWGAEFFSGDPPLFQPYLDMLKGSEWDDRFPAILNISPSGVTRMVEGHRRTVTWAWLKRPEEIPVIHCYSLDECAHWLREVYGVEIDSRHFREKR